MSLKLFKTIKNNQSNSFFRNSRRSGRLVLLLLLGGTLTFCSCRSGASGRLYQPASDDPYAQNAPKNAQEEAYYQDVYSGGWKEQQNPFGMGSSIVKKTGSTQMPDHWAIVPEGATPMSQIRSEMAAQKSRAVYQRAPQVNYSQNGSGLAVDSNVSYQATETATQNANLPPTQTYSLPSNSTGSNYQNYNQTNNIPANNSTTNSSDPSNLPFPSLGSPLGKNETNNKNWLDSGSLIIRGQSPDVVDPEPSETEKVEPSTPNVSETEKQNLNPNRSKRAVLKASNVKIVKVAQQSGAESSVPTDASSETETSPANDLDDFFAETTDENSTDLFESLAEPTAETTTDSATEETETDSPQTKTQATQPETATVPARQEETVQNAKTQNVQASSETAEQTSATDSATIGQTTASQTLTSSVPLNANQRIGGQVRPLNVDPTYATPWRQIQRPDSVEAIPNRQRTESFDEYIVGGSDSKGEAYSLKDWSVHHLDSEDTIAHFDTVDGQILVEPSNQVQIYSPRFGSVRQVIGPREGEYDVRLHNAQTEIGAVQKEETLGIDVRSQEEKADFARGNQRLTSAESRTISSGVSNEQGVMEASAEIKIGDMISLLTNAVVDQKEMAILTGGSIAAQSWGELQGVKVALDNVAAQSNVYNEGVQTVFVVDDGTKTSKLQLIKIASKETAQPGELVEFTIRFENVGDQPIGNVTILDNLSARLRFLENSAKSSVPAEFLADQNENGSLILRWEITDPLEPGDFGVVQFLCKVL